MEHAAAHHHAVRQGAQLGVVGGSYQVQVAVGIKVRPGNRVGREPSAKLVVLLAHEGGAAGVLGGRGAPPRRQAAGVREHQVEVAVAVHVHHVHGAGAGRLQVAAPEQQAALVPQQRGGAVQAGEHDVGEPVAVQVGQRHPGAVALEEADVLVRPARVVGQRRHLETAGALPRVGGERRTLDRNRNVGQRRRGRGQQHGRQGHSHRGRQRRTAYAQADSRRRAQVCQQPAAGVGQGRRGTIAPLNSSIARSIAFEAQASQRPPAGKDACVSAFIVFRTE